jgi:xylose isomerase
LSGPQWAAAYEGQALFHAPTRERVGFENIIRHYGEIGIANWSTHDTDIIPTRVLGTEEQWAVVERVKKALQENGVRCSMVTTETFFHEVWAAGPAAEAPEVREYAKYRLKNTVKIGLGRRGAERGLRGGHRDGQAPRPPDAQALPGSQAFRAAGGNPAAHPEMVGLNPEYLHELMWGGAVRAALARALLAGKLWHFDINDGYKLKHDVDIAIGLVNPLDWLNILVLLRSLGYNGPFNLDYKPPRTTSNFGVFSFSFPSAVDRFITLWEMAGEVIEDPIIKEATEALKAGGGAANPHDADAVTAANKELLTLHELIAHRLVQIPLGLHRGRMYSV